MSALIIVGICSLLVSLILTPFFRDLFGFLDLVDVPDNHRKLHGRPIPRIGGIPVAISYFVILAIVLVIASLWKGIFKQNDPSILLLIRLIPAAMIVFATGLIDDFRGLSPSKKIAGQFIGAAWACWAGIHLGPVSAPPLPQWWIYPLTVFWLVFCMNAFNLIDGLDGLASGVALMAAIGTLIAALIQHNPALALAIVPLVGGLLGFLYYNRNPASIFLGDGGSLLVGFLLGCYGLLWNQGTSTGLGLMAPLVAMAFPTIEVAVSVMRRFLRQQPIFDADRNHIHHRLLSLGLTQRAAALVLCGVSGLAAALAVLQTVVHPRAGTVLLLLFCSLAYLGLRQLKYVEFGVFRRFLVEGEIRVLLRLKICVKEAQQAIARATDIGECWEALAHACQTAGFTYVCLNAGGSTFEQELRPGARKQSRQLAISLMPSGSVIFCLEGVNPLASSILLPLIDAVEAKLQIIWHAEQGGASSTVSHMKPQTAGAG